MKNASKQQGMWDILIPILLTIVVLPLAVRLAIYSCGYSGYEWYSVNDTLTDFYCYYKGYFLDIIGIFAGIILAFRLALYREKTKGMKLFIPLAVYCVFILLSTIFSINADASLKGNFESFESCIVLIVYVILALYAYQIMESERDYRYIWYAILVISAIFAVIGTFQIFGYDLMNFEWVQQLIMTEEQFSLYRGEIEDTFTGNNVYLTLYNPNYAGVTLCMLFAVIWTMALSETRKKIRIFWFVCSAVMLTLIWFTYSRASLLAALMILVLGTIKFLKQKKHLLIGIAGIIALFAVFICIDAALDFKYLSRIADKNTREPLTAMTTDENGIHMTYDGTEYCLYLENDTLLCVTDAMETPLITAEGHEMSLPFESGAEAVFYENEIYLYVAENTLNFIHEDDMYYYITPSMAPAQMISVEATDFHGLEYLGSARGYIWSRTLPLLKDHIFIGSGPDTFAEVFPQHDYAGKVVYSDRPDMIIEKAHNDYLTKWVQTGGISVLCILVFYILFIKKGIHGYAQIDDMRTRLGFGCYLACLSFMFTSLFNDSTLQTSPFFWVFAGIALSSIYSKNKGLS
ncbi:MAG: hypothetical protein E7289_03495 [Lachnospiraceae bacterium]|nr:hypothetical protein [Lachnospiraceae bacterium]